jgi:hypothetical protein
MLCSASLGQFDTNRQESTRVDEERNRQDESEQEVEPADSASTEATATRPKTMFDRDEDRAEIDAMTREARKRAAIWGLAAGGVMSLILVVCAVLIYLLGTS